MNRHGRAADAARPAVAEKQAFSAKRQDVWFETHSV